MTDDQQQSPQSVGDDPLTSLEALLQAAKAKRKPSENEAQQPGAEVAEEPAGPTPEELNAQRQAELAVQEEVAEATRLQELRSHQEKMRAVLEGTPQYIARQEQEAQAQKERQQKQAEQQGHVIHQIGEDKL